MSDLSRLEIPGAGGLIAAAGVALDSDRRHWQPVTRPRTQLVSWSDAVVGYTVTPSVFEQPDRRPRRWQSGKAFCNSQDCECLANGWRALTW